ncbi:Hpt domain-containing protein [Aquicella lusitana]|uniref:HPt (Histidine-containing phosphotransfer) domain-containing protein n=1 Tax=Aquicella lusitana TaxID=254246 RepID=A0A370GAY5_9COXI|nr:Hpt domain-containing protein [Aquicella lusitana]RDI40992.1 HPt (histidine-containing phosphotransfer) domain-containing protein [Aquicella lusitana]VVC73603.1 hypothetical protein AQULUS_13500 [Aquicella lusitana]
MDLDHLPVIDNELGMKLAGNRQELADEILGMFMKTLPAEMATIRQLYQDRYYGELLQRVHKLHGAICYCGLPRLKIVIAQLESELKNNIMIDLPSLFDQLQAETNLLLEHYSHQHSQMLE